MDKILKPSKRSLHYFSGYPFELACCEDKDVPEDCLGLCREKKEEQIRRFISVCDEWREDIKDCGGANWDIPSNLKYIKSIVLKYNYQKQKKKIPK